jgi:hypothetical protein
LYANFVIGNYKTYLGLHVKYSIFLPDLNLTWIVLIDIQKIHTIKPIYALMLKLYFYTQSVITTTCFDLSWSSSGSYLTQWIQTHPSSLLQYRVGYQNINLTSSWYEPLWTPMKLQPQRLMNQFSTATNKFHNIYRHCMDRF